MDALLLQDWVTLQGHDGVTSIEQSAHTYVDIGTHEDLVFYIDVKDITGSVSISLQTSPTLQSSTFVNMIAPVAIAVGLQTARAMFATAAVPPARYVRWAASVPGSAWSATFRIWMTAYDFG